MNYTDTIFYLLFIPLVILIRLCSLPIRIREWIIIAASAVFLASWGTVSLLIFCEIAFGNFLAAFAISRVDRKLSRYILTATIAVNISALAYFKYYNFFVDSIRDLTGTAVQHQSIGLPLAISFYTFHLISYLVELQSRRTRLANVREYLLYIGFFPHLVAGPIVRPWQFFPQIGKIRDLARDLPFGLHQLVVGAFLKSIIADNIAELIDPIWAGTADFAVSSGDKWVVAFLYYCQIYADFAGYSLMALGMSRLLGYRLPQNFRQPMFASSLQEFWRRWHITLSRWLRDYLYKPLGGNRGGPWRVGFNLMATMVLGGLWHGAGWTFIIWGTMHGAGLWAERAMGLNRGKGAVRLGWFFVTQLWVTVAWIFFRAPDLTQAIDFLKDIANVTVAGLVIHPPIQLAFLFGCGALFHQIYQLGIIQVPRRLLPAALGVTSALFFVADIIVYAPPKAFIYFKF
jgi:alginate O-acetyltransferase complex protein AlgI